MNEHPSPEFEKEIREAFGTTDADPAFVQTLRATILERTTMRKETRSFYRLAWGLALAALVIGFLIASPRVVEAMKKLLGYIPGIGYVEQGTSLRLLSTPVSIEQEGVKLTVEKGAVDAGHTTLLTHVEGTISNGDPDCFAAPRLLLPDGTLLGQIEGQSAWGTGVGPFNWYERYTFEAMPAGQLEAKLEIPCIMGHTLTTALVLPLNFDIAGEGQVMPVIELPTQTAASASVDSAVQGFSIVLESETPLAEGYVLSGSYQWTDPRFDARSLLVSEVEITAADGRAVEFVDDHPENNPDPDARKLAFTYRITGKDHAYPLTLTVKALDLTLHADSTFQFDAGPAPKVGQTWDVNRDVTVGEHVLHVESIELIEGSTPTQLGFNFNITSDPEVTRASIDDLHPIVNGNGNGGGGGGGGGGGPAGHSFAYGWFMDGYSPAGLKTFVVSDITVATPGTWQTTWQPTTK